MQSYHLTILDILTILLGCKMVRWHLVGGYPYAILLSWQVKKRSMDNLEGIKARANLVELASNDTRLAKISGAAGGEWAGPCPKCGGQDRLHVQGRGLWMCRQCQPKWQDVIAYLEWARGLDFKGAVAYLGGELQPGATPKRAETGPKQPLERPRLELPGPEWQEKGAAFVEWAEKQLARCQAAMDYLLGRGLSAETIKAARLGYNPKPMFRPAKPWGLMDKPTLYIAAGWIIPCYTATGALAYIKIRQPEGISPKYKVLSGGHKALYGAERVIGRPDLILCEGEFDSLLAWQYAAGVADVVTLASAQANPAADDIAIMAGARRIWLAYDTDKPGQEGADKLAALSGRIRRLAWPEGAPAMAKDITDLWKAGILLSPWMISQLGPQEPAARAKWLTFHLERLDEPAGAAGNNEGAPALAAWLALLAAYDELVAAHIDGE